MEPFELIFKYRGFESLLGILMLIGGVICICEFILRSLMIDIYYRKGPLVTKKTIRIKKDDLSEALNRSSRNITIIAKEEKNYYILRFKTSIQDFFLEGTVYTQRIVIYFDETSGQVECEARQLLSSILLPLIVSTGIILINVSSDYQQSIYLSIVMIITGIMFGVGFYLYLRGKTDILEELEKKILTK